jgi:hypothetical protein
MKTCEELNQLCLLVIVLDRQRIVKSRGGCVVLNGLNIKSFEIFNKIQALYMKKTSHVVVFL